MKTHYEKMKEYFPGVFDVLSEIELPDNFNWEDFIKTNHIQELMKDCTSPDQETINQAQQRIKKAFGDDAADKISTNVFTNDLESTTAIMQLMFHMYAFGKPNTRIYEISNSIAEMLMNTKLDIDTEMVKSPFQEIMLIVPPEFIDIYNVHTGYHEVRTIYVNFTEKNGKILKVFSRGEAHKGDTEWNDAFFYFKVLFHDNEKISDSVKREMETWKKTPVYETFKTINDEEKFPRLFQFVINVLLYITSADSDLRYIKSEQEELIKKLDGLKNPSKIRKLQSKIDRTSALGKYVIGGSIQLSKEERDLFDAMKHSGYHHSIKYPVGGHWRWQVHGPQNSLRKHIWIRPHFRGPELAEIIKNIGVIK